MAPDFDTLEFQIWLQNGIARGWVSDPFCAMHDEPLMSVEENSDMEQYGETCLRSVRVWR